MIKANSTAPAINVIESEKGLSGRSCCSWYDKRRFQHPHRRERQSGRIDGEKEEKNEDKKEGRYLRREFSYSKFQQTMVLPENAEKEKDRSKSREWRVEHHHPENERGSSQES